MARGIGPSDSAAEFADLYEGALKQWFNSSIRPSLADVARDFEVLEIVVTDAKRWGDYVLTPPEPLSADEFAARFREEVNAMWDGLAKAFKFKIDDIEKRCQMEDGRYAHEAVSMVRYYLLADAMDPKDENGKSLGKLWGNQGLDRENVNVQIESCFSFDLSFRSRVEANFEGLTRFIAQVAVSDIDLSLDFDADEVHATVSLPYEIFEFDIDQPGVNCRTSTIPGEVRFELYANFNVRYAQVVTDMEIDLVFLSSPQETWDCGRPVTTKLWHAHFADLNELVGQPPDLTIELDIVHRADAFAIWEFEGETSLKGYETSIITLVHTPRQ